jgi:putative ABC transport system permease protein
VQISARPLPRDLAIRELRHDWQAAACFVSALVGVLAPLVILLALKNGVIGSMVDRLVEDPSNREIIAIGAESYDKAFFVEIGSRDDVGFLTPATRRINAAASAVRNPVNRALERGVPLVPSADGDPLLSDGAARPGAVWLSHSLSQALSLSAGEQIEMLIGREIDGNRETARVTFQVAGIAAPDAVSQQAMFLSLPDLLAVEAFRDDKSITVETYDTRRAPPERYASFRLYARDLTDLPALLGALEARGVQVRPRAENATLLLAFRSNLNLLYIGIAIIAVAGFWAAMAANLRGMVERQRVVFSLLLLLGMSRGAAARVPLIQSVILVLGGVFVTLILTMPVLLVINAVFVETSGDALAKLGVVDVVVTVLLGVLTAGTAALWAMRSVSQIETEEVLRNG